VNFPQRERLRPGCSFAFGRALPAATASPASCSESRQCANRPCRLPMTRKGAPCKDAATSRRRARERRAASSKRPREGHGVKRSCMFAPRSSRRRCG